MNTKYILRLTRWEQLLCFSLIFCQYKATFFDWRNFLVDAVQNPTFSLLTYLIKNYTIFLHQVRQLTWWYYTFERDTQFWYTINGNFRFHDDFMFLSSDTFLHQDMQLSWWFYDLNKIHNFYQVDILYFPGTLWKKGCTNQYSMLSLTRNNKKSKNRKKLTSAKILPRQQYRLQDCACKVLMLNWYNTDLRSCSHCFHVCIPHMRTRLCACHILGAFIFLASTIWSMWLSEPLCFCPRCVRECYTNVIQLLILLNSPLSSSA